MTTPTKLSPTDPKVTGCAGFVHQTNAAQLMASDPDLVSYLDTVPPGVDYFFWGNSVWQYVNNEDGSLGDTYPDVPPQNTGIFACSGQLASPGSSKTPYIIGGVVLLVVLVGGGIWIATSKSSGASENKRKRKKKRKKRSK